MAPLDQLAVKVISAGRMSKTVTVQIWKQEWNRHLRKNYTVPYKVLVHDANNSLITGDTITLRPEVHSKRVQHAVKEIIAPFGKPISERPPLLNVEPTAAAHHIKANTHKGAPNAKIARRRQRHYEKRMADVAEATKAQSVTEWVKAVGLDKFQPLLSLEWDNMEKMDEEGLDQLGLDTGAWRRRFFKYLQTTKHLRTQSNT